MEFTCLTCSKEFETEDIIRQHIIDAHNGKPIEVDMDDEMEVFQCDTCLQEFLSEECVKQHIRCCHRSRMYKFSLGLNEINEDVCKCYYRKTNAV